MQMRKEVGQGLQEAGAKTCSQGRMVLRTVPKGACWEPRDIRWEMPIRTLQMQGYRQHLGEGGAYVPLGVIATSPGPPAPLLPSSGGPARDSTALQRSFQKLFKVSSSCSQMVPVVNT